VPKSQIIEENIQHVKNLKRLLEALKKSNEEKHIKDKENTDDTYAQEEEKQKR